MSEPRTAKPAEDLFTQLRDSAFNTPRGLPAPPEGRQPKRLDQKIRRLEIENNIAEADQQLKVKTLVILFVFLSVETVVVFLLAFFQGFGWQQFQLDEWSFRIVVAATIGQITAMLTIAVQHLFPKKERR